jgi:hypothetical protein
VGCSRELQRLLNNPGEWFESIGGWQIATNSIAVCARIYCARGLNDSQKRKKAAKSCFFIDI